MNNLRRLVMPLKNKKTNVKKKVKQSIRNTTDPVGRMQKGLNKLLKYQQKSPNRPKEAFNPEGKGYDYKSAMLAGMGPDPKNKHWGSRNPKTGQMLKGRSHKTWNLGVQGETDAGYQIRKGADGKYYSKKAQNPDNSAFMNKPKKKPTTKKKGVSYAKRQSVAEEEESRN